TRPSRRCCCCCAARFHPSGWTRTPPSRCCIRPSAGGVRRGDARRGRGGGAAAGALLHPPLGGADPLAERRLRQGLRALALAAGDRRPSGVLLVEAIGDPTGLDMVDRRWALPAQAVAKLIATAREAAAAPGATAEQVLWTVWRASGLADRWYALSTRGAPTEPGSEGGRARQGAAEAADRDLDAM